MSKMFSPELAKEMSDNKVEKLNVPKYYTDDELLGLKDEHAYKSYELLKKQEEFKDIAKEWKDEIKEIKAVTEDLTKKIHDKFEYQDRDCFVTPDFQEMTISHIDTETGKVYSKRQMTPKERQLTVGSFNHIKMREVNNA